MIVADASVIAAVLADDHELGDRVRSFVRLTAPVVVPDIAVVEVMSVLRRHLLAGLLSESRYGHAVADFADMPLTVHSTKPATGRISELARNVTPYDAVYVWLAETLACPLVTSDARLARSPGINCIVHLID